MPRVTNSDVLGIFATDIATTPFIVTANLIVNEELVPLALYSEARLFQLELWLSAHFACMLDPRETSVQAGATASFEGKTAMGLDFTRYGQQVKILDKSGTLARLDKLKGRITVASRIETPVWPQDVFNSNGTLGTP